MSKIFLAIPNMGWLRSDLFLRTILWMLERDVTVYAPEGLRPIPFARNKCVKKFMLSDATHLWFVDADTLPPVAAPDKLLVTRVPAISGVVRQMKLDEDGIVKPVGMVMRRDKNRDLKEATGHGVEQIDACGSGCILFERAVFETIPFPWYEERPWGAVRGSDLILGEKMAAADIPLYAHFGVDCVHRKEIDF